MLRPRSGTATQGRSVAVVERAADRVRLVVKVARFRRTQNEGLVFRDVGIVTLTESPGLVLLIGVRANEVLNFRALEQGVDIVVVPHELNGRVTAFLLSTEFRRDRLQLFYEGVAGIIAEDALCPVVNDSTLPAA